MTVNSYNKETGMTSIDSLLGLYILTTEQVFNYLCNVNGNAPPKKCSIRSLNNRISKGRIPPNIIVRSQRGTRVNLWVVTNPEHLKELM